jgi:hypothetical protein
LDSSGACIMHDIVIALAFVAMVICPVIIAAIPGTDTKED